MQPQLSAGLWQTFYLRSQKYLEVCPPIFTKYVAYPLISKDWTPYCTADETLYRKHHESTDVWIKFSITDSTGPMFITAMLLCCILYYVEGMTVVSCLSLFLDTFFLPFPLPPNYDFLLWSIYLFEFHFIDCFHCLSELRKEFVICILQDTISCPVYDKKRGESLKHLIIWNLNNLSEFRKKTKQPPPAPRTWFCISYKIMLRVSTFLFPRAVCCTTHGLSPNECPHWSSAFQTEESITQYFYIKLTNSVQNVTPLLGRYPSLDSETSSDKITSSFSSSWRQVLQAVQPLGTAWTDIFTLLKWIVHDREQGDRANSVSLLQLHCILTSPSCKCIVGTIALLIYVTFPSLPLPDFRFSSPLAKFSWISLPHWQHVTKI